MIKKDINKKLTDFQNISIDQNESNLILKHFYNQKKQLETDFASNILIKSKKSTKSISFSRLEGLNQSSQRLFNDISNYQSYQKNDNSIGALENQDSQEHQYQQQNKQVFEVNFQVNQQLQRSQTQTRQQNTQLQKLNKLFSTILINNLSKFVAQSYQSSHQNQVLYDYGQVYEEIYEFINSDTIDINQNKSNITILIESLFNEIIPKALNHLQSIFMQILSKDISFQQANKQKKLAQITNLLVQFKQNIQQLNNLLLYVQTQIDQSNKLYGFQLVCNQKTNNQRFNLKQHMFQNITNFILSAQVKNDQYIFSKIRQLTSKSVLDLNTSYLNSKKKQLKSNSQKRQLKSNSQNNYKQSQSIKENLIKFVSILIQFAQQGKSNQNNQNNFNNYNITDNQVSGGNIIVERFLFNQLIIDLREYFSTFSQKSIIELKQKIEATKNSTKINKQYMYTIMLDFVNKIDNIIIFNKQLLRSLFCLNDQVISSTSNKNLQILNQRNILKSFINQLLQNVFCSIFTKSMIDFIVYQVIFKQNLLFINRINEDQQDQLEKIVFTIFLSKNWRSKVSIKSSCNNLPQNNFFIIGKYFINQFYEIIYLDYCTKFSSSLSLQLNQTQNALICQQISQYHKHINNIIYQLLFSSQISNKSSQYLKIKEFYQQILFESIERFERFLNNQDHNLAKKLFLFYQTNLINISNPKIKTQKRIQPLQVVTKLFKILRNKQIFQNLLIKDLIHKNVIIKEKTIQIKSFDQHFIKLMELQCGSEYTKQLKLICQSIKIKKLFFNKSSTQELQTLSKSQRNSQSKQLRQKLIKKAKILAEHKLKNSIQSKMSVILLGQNIWDTQNKVIFNLSSINLFYQSKQSQFNSNKKLYLSTQNEKSLIQAKKLDPKISQYIQKYEQYFFPNDKNLQNIKSSTRQKCLYWLINQSCITLEIRVPHISSLSLPNSCKEIDLTLIKRYSIKLNLRLANIFLYALRQKINQSQSISNMQKGFSCETYISKGLNADRLQSYSQTYQLLIKIILNDIKQLIKRNIFVIVDQISDKPTFNTLVQINNEFINWIGQINNLTYIDLTNISSYDQNKHKSSKSSQSSKLSKSIINQQNLIQFRNQTFSYQQKMNQTLTIIKSQQLKILIEALLVRMFKRQKIIKQKRLIVTFNNFLIQKYQKSTNIQKNISIQNSNKNSIKQLNLISTLLYVIRIYTQQNNKQSQTIDLSSKTKDISSKTKDLSSKIKDLQICKIYQEQIMQKIRKLLSKQYIQCSLSLTQNNQNQIYYSYIS